MHEKEEQSSPFELFWQKKNTRLTVWNLNAISGRTRSNQFVIFLPTNSGKMTSSELPMLRTTMSDLNRFYAHVVEWQRNRNMRNGSKEKATKNHGRVIKEIRRTDSIISTVLHATRISSNLNSNTEQTGARLSCVFIVIVCLSFYVLKFKRDSIAYPNTTQNGNISNKTDALIGRCFSSRVIASDARVNARLSKVNWNVTCTVSKRISSRISSICISLW